MRLGKLPLRKGLAEGSGTGWPGPGPWETG